MRISSLQNTKIKNIYKLLTKSSERKKQNAFVVEGVQENEFALQNGFKAIEFYIQPEIYTSKTNLFSSLPVFEVSKNVYAKIAYRSTTEGVVGLYQPKKQEICTQTPSTVLVLESIEKPGNLGAIIRTANAFGVSAICIADPKLDVFNPNVIRTSVGCVFTIPIFLGSKEEIFELLEEKKYTLYSTFMNAENKEIQEIDFSEKTALLFGTEHSGLTFFWKDKVFGNYLIPMQGSVDSLNLSNAVAISIYEVNRQRKSIKKPKS